MTDPTVASESATRPRRVLVYGNDHSPWVQSVLLGLHQKQIDHTVATAPRLSLFLRSGILMPAARIEDDPWLLDSERILVALGFHEVEAETHAALVAVFASGALQRTEAAWEFWRRFSYVRDGHPRLAGRLWHQFWRTFSTFYFFTLISRVRRRRPEHASEQLVAEFTFFQQRLLPEKPFFGGDTPDTVDLQLFGLVQMCASIPGRSLGVLRERPELDRLRTWIEAMQQRFSGYSHLYTAHDFEPRLPEIQRATSLERVFYWAGSACMWIGFPITMATAVFLASRVRRKGFLRP